MLIVDRIEGSLAVLEKPDRATVAIPLDRLPLGIKEGDCLVEKNGHYQLDQEEAARRRKQNQSLFHRLIDREDGSQS